MKEKTLVKLHFAAMAGVLTLAAVNLVGLSDEEGARKALTGTGYTDIQTQGHKFWGCELGRDLFKTEFTAKSARGKDVHGVVCRGLFKGATIRTF